MIDLSSLKVITASAAAPPPVVEEPKKQEEMPKMLRRRSSVTLSMPIFHHIETEEEKKAEKDKELQDRIEKRDSQRKLSVLHKSERDMAAADPTFEAAHRRRLMQLKPGEYEEAEPIAVPAPLHLKTKKAMVTMFRRLPNLDRPIDEETYEDCCDNVYELLTIQRSDEGWKCMKIIGQSVSPSGQVTKEACETSNAWGSKKCKVCFAEKPRLRPFYKKLQRLSKAMKERRAKLVKLITQADADQTRYEKDLELADYKLEAEGRRREELDKEYYLFLDRSGQSQMPMAAVLADHTCHARFVEYLTCIRNGESVGEDDDEPLIMFHDEEPVEKKEEVVLSSDDESDTEEE